MKVFCRENDTFFKAEVRITADRRLTIHVQAPFGEDNGYVEIGKHGVPLESHSTYSVLYNDEGYLVRDKENKQYRSNIKILPTNQITMGSRMKYEEVENRYGGMVLMQVDTNTISGSAFELQVQLFRLSKEDTVFHLRPNMQIEYADLDMDEVFAQGSKRHSFWDTYSLSIDGVEYKRKERETNELAGVVDVAGREYIEMKVQKYSNGFTEQLNREADNEEVFIECTGGVTNCQRVKLANGRGQFRWYALGYEGLMKIKLGWRWYSGVAEIRLAVKQQ